jgi:hypothetical protein
VIRSVRQRNDAALTGVIDLTVERQKTPGFKRLDGDGA